MLLFNDDIASRSRITALFLEAQAAIGLGYRRHGNRVLRRVLELDPSHPHTSDLLAELSTEAALREHAGIKA
jgi:hypothetical protein